MFKLKFLKKIIPRFIWEKIKKNIELQKIIFNINWLFLDKAIEAILAFFVGVWVIRYLGPEKYGILSYAVALTAIFGVLSKLGLEFISVREIVRGKNEKEKVLGSVFLLKLIGGFLALILSVLTVFFFKKEDMIVIAITLIISLGFIFRSTEVIDYWFKSQIKSKYIVFARSASFIISALIKIGLILFKAPLIAFAWVILIESIASAMGLLIAYKMTKEKIISWKFDFGITKKILYDSWPLALSGIAILIYMKIDQVMIGNMLGNEYLGNYSVAVKLSEAWYFIPNIIITTVFPSIIYSRENNYSEYINKLQLLYIVMVWMGILVAIPITIFSRQIVVFLFGSQFVMAQEVLRIYVWAGIFVFLGNASAKYLIAENYTKITFLKSFIGAIINVILNLLLIPRFGINGAAMATLISYAATVVFLIFPRKTRINRRLFINAFNPFFVYKLTKEILIENNKSIKLEEDLLSRGWVEIISGKHARENKSFYIMPKLDGTHDFTLNYSYKDLKENNDGDLLIWELAEKKNLKVGIMNVPTTYPAPKVNGFFVSGAGGGLYSVKGIPREMCDSEKTLDILKKKEYIIDLRFKPSGIEDIDILFKKLEEMLLKRTESFIDLSKKENPELAFLVFRAPSVIFYLAMSEIEYKYNKIWNNKMEHFFELFDDNLKKIFNELNPENFIITADHGMVSQKYHANYNVFLQKYGYLKKNIRIMDYAWYFIKKILIPILNLLGFHYFETSPGKINWEKTKVFGDWYSNGLYINDKKRFNGSVLEESINKTVEKVCQDLNNCPEARKYNLKAFSYREKYKEYKFYDWLPDIWIDTPDEIFNFGQNKNFINKNPWFGKIRNLKHIPSSMFTGIKGRRPICIMNENLARLIENNDARDLTLIYKITDRFFKNF